MAAFQRPTCAEIASTPLEQLPGIHSAEAERFTQEGESALSARLSAPLTKLALKHQGVEAADLLTVAAATGKDRTRSGAKTVGSQQHLQQLLGQVFWEEDELRKADNVVHASPRNAINNITLRDLRFGGLMGRSKGQPPTSWPISRPHSAREVRHAKIVQFGRLTRRNWEFKEKAVAAAQEERAKLLQGVKDRKGEHNSALELQAQEFKETEAQRLLERGNQILTNQARRSAMASARIASDGTTFQQTRAFHHEKRWAEAAENRSEIIHQRQQQLHGMVEATNGKTARAVGLREKTLLAKSMGPSQLHSSRQLADWQAARITKLKEHQRQTWQNRHDEQTSFTQAQHENMHTIHAHRHGLDA